ncbi:unnamed protein product [Ectocarpus sp. 8 AP-2014]
MPYNYLHDAALKGSAKLTEALLAKAALDINERTEDGFTPLNVAAQEGHHRVARILLRHNASVTVASENGCTPLMLSAQNGHVVVTKLLIDAGSDVNAATDEGITSLHQAADEGHSEILSMLVNAGANPDIRAHNGSTPLYDAAFHGHLDIVRRLLRFGVRPAVPRFQPDGSTRVALDVAAQKGHSEVVHELIQYRGIKTCAGATGGAIALNLATKHQHVDTMRLLLAAGVVDTGMSLFTAATLGRERAVKLLLQQKWATPGDRYIDSRNECHCTPLFVAVSAAAPRIVRLLLDAGANEKLTRPVSYSFHGKMENETLLELADNNLRYEVHDGRRATTEETSRLEEARRLLMRVEAVRAVSWLWGTTSPAYAIPLGTDGNKDARGGASRLGVRIARRETRAHSSGALLATLFRYAYTRS